MDITNYFSQLFITENKVKLVIFTLVFLLFVFIIRFGTEKFNSNNIEKMYKKGDEYLEMSKYSWKMRIYLFVALAALFPAFLSQDNIAWFNSVLLTVISIFEFDDNRRMYKKAKKTFYDSH